MSNKELQKRVREMGQSERGSRPVLVQMYERDIYHNEHSRGDAGAESQAGRAASHASEDPMTVIVDETTGNKYMNVIDHKGLNGDGDSSWLIKDMHQELNAWGSPGGRRMRSY